MNRNAFMHSELLDDSYDDLQSQNRSRSRSTKKSVTATKIRNIIKQEKHYTNSKKSIDFIEEKNPDSS